MKTIKTAIKTAKGYTRRQFVAGSAAAVAATQLPLHAQQATRTVMPPPEITSGEIIPLMAGATARPMRYHAEGAEFVITNGAEFFNRPLYGPNNAFRVDAGDLPEFSLYMPGHGGNLRLGLAVGSHAKWLAQAAKVTARYRPGRMIYEVSDDLLGAGTLRIELLTAGSGSGLLLRAEGRHLASSVSLTWAYGGASGRKGRRSGDIGCELQPVARFFELRPEECAHNQFTLDEVAVGKPVTASLHSPFCDFSFLFPAGSNLRVADVGAWQTPVRAERIASEQSLERPILTGSVELDNSQPKFISITRTGKAASPALVAEHVNTAEHANASEDLQKIFAARSAHLEEVASTLRAATSDSTIDAACAALGTAADALWDEAQQCVMHGGVAWRVPLPGWRGPYLLDALGWHQRAQRHFRHWIAGQNSAPISGSDPATGSFDAGSNLSRKEGLLHSNGDIAHNHYDMNLVFFDAVLRHLRWTGDMEFAREIWPALKRHLAWEKRLFRRVYKTNEGRELPLYEAYAAIWASDNLQYNGGGAAHSTAYVLFANREAARLAHLLGEDAAPYEQEAKLIDEGLHTLIWLPEQGALAESKDILANQTVYNNPALWTLYHAIDSEAVSPVEACQMIAERLSVLRKIPVHGEGVPMGDWYLLSCSNWLPYVWSLNLLVMAENLHMALAMWQTGMADEAYKLFKGNLLDSMFQGITPGNFHMTSQLDAHRQEAQRDFGDPTGIAARALVEGLFGLQPDLIAGVLRIRPGFPSDWNHASLRHADFDLAWKREANLETIEVASRLPKPVALELRLRARGTGEPRVMARGVLEAAFDQEAVGGPQFVVKLPAANAWKLQVEWRGARPLQVPALRKVKIGEAILPSLGAALTKLDDPQKALDATRRARAEGFHTLFAHVRDGASQWQMPIAFSVQPKPILPLPENLKFTRNQLEPVELGAHLNHQLNTLLTRDYSEPRSPFCSLALPSQLVGGWANNNLKSTVDDSGLRAAGGVLSTALGVPFRTPVGDAPNCLFLSQWKLDVPRVEVALHGRAEAVYLLMTGTTYPQASRITHGRVKVGYRDGSQAELPLVNPESWWPVNEDYLFDDYLFVDDAQLPARVDLATGRTRLLDTASFKGKGRAVPGGAATILGLALDPKKDLASLVIECEIYGVVLALLAATLVRPQA